MEFNNWYRYFLSNKDHFRDIDWNDRKPLHIHERTIISASIQQFQRGEYSEGKHFKSFAATMRDENYGCTIPLFIKEEQDHSGVLGRFMAIHQIPELKKHWLDDVFRGLRKIAGLEGIITVLLTAEMILMVYYKALSKATGSDLLQKICKQVLKDEVMHLRFQSYSLQVLYNRKSKAGIRLSVFIHRVLQAGTIIAVWRCHNKVLKAGGYRFSSFSRDVWKEFRKCRKMIKGEMDCKPVFRKINGPDKYTQKSFIYDRGYR